MLYSTRLQKKIKKKEIENKCLICLKTCLYDSKKVTICCSGVYHIDCIRSWCKVSKNRCPICKSKLEENDLMDEDYVYDEKEQNV